MTSEGDFVQFVVDRLREDRTFVDSLGYPPPPGTPLDPDRMTREISAKQSILDLWRSTIPDYSGMTDLDLHTKRMHPDWEYETTITQRKSGESRKPEGEGWVPNDIVPMYVPAATEPMYRNWERFDFIEEEYWRRKRDKPAPATISVPTHLRWMATAWADHDDWRREWMPYGYRG